jgi:ribosome-binding protein aMBF1 (putative translation factor)
MTTPISTLELDGKRYAVIPLERVQALAPQLLVQTKVRVPKEGTPWEVVKRTLEENVSKAKAWREYLGLSQEDVAKRMKISQPALSKIESGKRLQKATREKLAKALGIRLEQLQG